MLDVPLALLIHVELHEDPVQPEFNIASSSSFSSLQENNAGLAHIPTRNGNPFVIALRKNALLEIISDFFLLSISNIVNFFKLIGDCTKCSNIIQLLTAVI